MRQNIYKEKLFDAPIEKVWAAITEPASLSVWFMQADFEPTLGYNFTFSDKPQGGWDGVLVGEVLAVQSPNLLEYSWKGNQMRHVTIVRWHLESRGTGTFVTLSHTGFKGFSDRIVSLFHQFGWNGYFKQLAKLLAEEV